MLDEALDAIRRRSWERIVVFTGAGVSADSGIPTFRGAGGLWRNFRAEDLATPEAFARDPALVWEWYEWRRGLVRDAQPNAAHLAIARLDRALVVTQNVDALHERAGSTRVLHVHGELAYARGTGRTNKRYRIDGGPIALGQCCEEGTQLRPDIVWFGEEVQHMEEAGALVASADKVLVVGTSLSVYPAAGLVEYARADAEKFVNALEMDDVPAGFTFRAGPATQMIPAITSRWLEANHHR